jgi:hypothetical protein
MKWSIACAFLLAGVSGGAMAAWVPFGSDEFGNTYVDPATLFRAGDKAKMWHLVDFNNVQTKPSGKRYISEKSQYEYDCKEDRARLLNFLAHTGNMGRGGMVEGDYRAQKWEALPPGSLLAHLRKFACAKR